MKLHPCNHANESPTYCHCPEGCYCKIHTCRAREESKTVPMPAPRKVGEPENLEHILTIAMAKMLASATPLNNATKGWICPRCERSNSPTLQHCDCIPTKDRLMK